MTVDFTEGLPPELQDPYYDTFISWAQQLRDRIAATAVQAVGQALDQVGSALHDKVAAVGGSGVATGGLTGQFLAKASNVSGDFEWISVPPGADGKSAYDLARDQGYGGTLTQWLASLKGDPGNPGSPGSPGGQGLSAYQVAVANGFSGNEAAWLASLVGPAGSPGTTTWAGITDKPTTFTPATHVHSAADLTSGTLSVSRGGTGRAAATSYSIIAGGTSTTGAQTSIASSTAGRVMVSAGAGAYPAFVDLLASHVSDATTVGRNVMKASGIVAAQEAIGIKQDPTGTLDPAGLPDGTIIIRTDG